MTTVTLLGARIQDLQHNIRNNDEHSESFNHAFTRVEKTIGQITDAAEQNSDTCTATLEHMRELSSDVSKNSQAIDAAKKRTEQFLQASERLTELSAACGAQTEDTPFIAQVLSTAEKIRLAFEQALSSGQLTEADLFDRDYQAITDSNPAQFSTRYLSFVDRALPPIQEPLLEFSSKVVFCAAVDINGYLPTHNLKFSKPQGHDVTWNTANCRNRRIFNDRTGLSAGRNTRKFLLQIYRRDMGGGHFVLMKDLSAPIVAHGKHWGGVRLAYQL